MPDVITERDGEVVLTGGRQTQGPSQLSEDRVRPEAGEGPPAAGAGLIAQERGAGGVHPREVLLKLIELRSGSRADSDVEGSLSQDAADGPAKIEGEWHSRADPARSSALGGGLHVGDAVVPLDVRYLPTSAREQEHDRAVASDLETRGDARDRVRSARGARRKGGRW